MPTKEQGNVVMHGPTATHDVICPVYGCTNSAVLQISVLPSVFDPCWKCQDKHGLRTVKLGKISRWWFRDVLKRI